MMARLGSGSSNHAAALGNVVYSLIQLIQLIEKIHVEAAGLSQIRNLNLKRILNCRFKEMNGF